MHQTLVRIGFVAALVAVVALEVLYPTPNVEPVAPVAAGR